MPEAPESSTTAKRDLLICVASVIGLFALAAYLDLSEAWHAWSGSLEKWEIDELLIALGLGSGAFSWYSYRRWRESRAEADLRIRINRDLANEIAARRETESWLRESEERLRQASQLAKLGYYVRDAVEDSCLFCSEEHARVHGLTPDEYRAQASSLNEACGLIHPEDQGAFQDARRALRAGQSFEMEYRTVTSGGEIRNVREIAKPFFDSSGVLVQEVGTSQDVTEIKRAEARLRQAQKMEAIGQLTGGVAHDFNNLLAVIMGNIELLGDRLGRDDRTLDEISRAGARGAELVQRLLAFSRRQPLHPQAVDLFELVSGMSELLRRSLGATIEFEISGASNLDCALVDLGQLESAILNLVLNARDAMPGGGKLTIDCRAAGPDDIDLTGAPKSAGYVVLAVGDTGSGMTAEVRGHAVEPFFTTKEVGEGSGLGLSMVYGFAQQSGGDLVIRSEPDQGTTVNLYLPSTTSTVRRAEALPDEVAPRGRGELVLLLEDDAEVRALVARMLENLDYRVIAVADASAAHTALSDGPAVDLVLSDVVLPGGISGPDFAGQARASFPHLRIVFMSGYPAEHNGFLGTSGVLLRKPFQRSELAKALQSALE